MDGLSTIGTILKMAAQPSSLTEVPDLQVSPGLMGAPDKIETTTMKNTSRTYIPGLKDPEIWRSTFCIPAWGRVRITPS